MKVGGFAGGKSGRAHAFDVIARCETGQRIPPVRPACGFATYAGRLVGDDNTCPNYRSSLGICDGSIDGCRGKLCTEGCGKNQQQNYTRE